MQFPSRKVIKHIKIILRALRPAVSRFHCNWSDVLLNHLMWYIRMFVGGTVDEEKNLVLRRPVWFSKGPCWPKKYWELPTLASEWYWAAQPVGSGRCRSSTAGSVLLPSSCLSSTASWQAVACFWSFAVRSNENSQLVGYQGPKNWSCDVSTVSLKSLMRSRLFDLSISTVSCWTLQPVYNSANEYLPPGFQASASETSTLVTHFYWQKKMLPHCSQCQLGQTAFGQVG